MKKNNNYIKSYFSILIIFSFLFLAFGSGETKSNNVSGPKIENESEIKNYICGKWQTSFFDMGKTQYYRFEITDSEIKYWGKFDSYPSDKDEPWGIHPYTLGSIRTHDDGSQFRMLDFDGEDLVLMSGNYLTYENNCLQFHRNCLEKGWK